MSLPLSQAYLEQARVDFSTYKIIKTNAQQPTSQWLHLLQMTLEKTAKAYLAVGTPLEQLRQSHRAFGRFLGSLPRQHGSIIQVSLNLRSNDALKAHIDSLKPLVYEIERIIPTRGYDGPTAEYPFKNPRGGGFISPCFHGFDEILYQLEQVRHADDLQTIVHHALYDDEWHRSFGIMSA